jgi:uncharacterized RmlC-like cupin family protein
MFKTVSKDGGIAVIYVGRGFLSGGNEISQESCGANIFMGVKRVPPGQTLPLHRHPDVETAVYMLGGRTEVYDGEKNLVAECYEGDMCYIAKSVAHEVRSVGADDAVFVYVRSGPTEITEYIS